MRKRGFSDIIAVVFFVVTALVVFVILYNSYMGFVRNSSGKMENQFLSLLDRFFATDSTTTLAGGVIHLDGTYEGCFVELEINEVKTGDILDETGNVIGADIDFNLEGQENLYGIYSGQVDYYDSEMPGDYVLNTYDSSGNLLSKYSAYSGRFIFYDSFDETTNESGGGIIETEEAVISVIIPYDERIDNVKIENNAEEFNLGVNAGNFACERICKIGGEEISEEDSCCAGFIPFEFNDVFKCSNQSGCESYEGEERENCLEAFGVIPDFTCPDGYVKGEFGCEYVVEIAGCEIINESGIYVLQNNTDNHTGTCFIINADDVVLDGNGHYIDGDDSGSDYGVYANGRNNVIIKNFVITDFYYGVYFHSAIYSNLNNILTNSNSYEGIFLSSSSNNQLTNITANSNNDGIKLYANSNNNQLTNITANSNFYSGIALSTSSNNQFNQITACGNSYNDFHCVSSINNTGSNLVFGNGKVILCNDNWPILGVNYEAC